MPTNEKWDLIWLLRVKIISQSSEEEEEAS
jgi:hypothetical protein